MFDDLAHDVSSQLLTFLVPREDDPPRRNVYGYVPTLAVCILFIALFAVSTAAHSVQAVIHRTWYVFPTIILCGLLELVGWGGRLWSSREILETQPFTMQITCTIMAPTPLLAANFIILGRIIHILGTSYSRLGPKKYTIIFLTCDIISLALQGLGGGMASAAANNGRDLMPGTNLMLGGIVFQLVVIVFFMLLSTEFLFRYSRDKPFGSNPKPRGELNGHLKIMLYTMALSTICLFIRAIYRTAELSDGWDGAVMRTQWYFNLFDGGMITIAIYALNFGHPGIFLKESSPAKRSEKSSVEEI